ncbi:fanconi-associated nuclease 1, partial [Phenoliferia sp. Uapishka_3]
MARAPSATPGARGTSVSPSLFSPSPTPEAAPAITSLAEQVEQAPAEERISFYVQAIDQIVEAIFGEGKEAHLFTREEQDAVERFKELDYEPRYLFVRLYLRKRGWFRVSSIGYESDISDLHRAVATLSAHVPVAGPSKLKPASDPNVIDLTESDDESEEGDVSGELEGVDDFSRFAFDESTLAAGSPADLLKLLTGEEIVDLGKRMKVSAKKGTRRDYTAGLLKTSNQSTLSFFTQAAKGKGNGKVSTPTLGLKYDGKGNKAQQSSVVSQHALKTIGPCIQLAPAYISLFDRLSLVYHRTAYTSTSGTTSLTASLLARFGKRRYPKYEVTRTFEIFPSREVLIQFENALAAERQIEVVLETKARVPLAEKSGKGKGKESEKTKSVAQLKAAEERKQEQEEILMEGVKIYESVRKDWRACVKAGAKEDKEEEDEMKKGLLYYRKRFNPGWPLTRILYKAAAIFARLGDHDKEREILESLLRQTSFRRGKRGAWHERLALVLMNYPSGRELQEGLSEAKKVKLANARRCEALAVCLRGLEDPYTHLVYIDSLQRRVKRIESLQKVDESERHTFGDQKKTKYKKRTIIGVRLDEPTIGRKSVWKSIADPEDEVSVEDLVLEHFEHNENMKGIHSESGVLTTIFALCFWSILFTPVDGVFETPYQAAPLDLATDAFSFVRKKMIERRLTAISKGKAAELMSIPDDEERPHDTFCVGVNWKKYSKSDLTEIVNCIGGETLAKICRVFAEDYGARVGGIPDLWSGGPSVGNSKGPASPFLLDFGRADLTRSNMVQVWIQVLLSAGVPVEVCGVMTEEDKILMDEKNEERKEKAVHKKRGREEQNIGSDDDK